MSLCGEQTTSDVDDELRNGETVNEEHEANNTYTIQYNILKKKNNKKCKYVTITFNQIENRCDFNVKC